MLLQLGVATDEREMTVRKSCKCGKYELFGHLLFIIAFVDSLSHPSCRELEGDASSLDEMNLERRASLTSINSNATTATTDSSSSGGGHKVSLIWSSCVFMCQLLMFVFLFVSSVGLIHRIHLERCNLACLCDWLCLSSMAKVCLPYMVKALDKRHYTQTFQADYFVHALFKNFFDMQPSLEVTTASLA